MQIISGNRVGEVVYFDTISFVRYVRENSKTKSLMKETKSDGGYKYIEILKISKEATPLETHVFFKELSKIVINKKSREIYSDIEHLGYFQFVLSNGEHSHFPVKWFSLIFENGIKIEHDFAFMQTYIKKNGNRVSFAPRKRMWEMKTKYIELKVKRNAYRFIANQVLKDN